MPPSGTTVIRLPRRKHPEALKQIPQPPQELYCRGNLALLENLNFAVVGSRKITPYGKEATEHLVFGLVRAGFTIVSGLALGIDAAAHRAALDAGGHTIAVLGCGVDDDSIYPRANFPLAQEILKKEGLIVSEYPDGTRATDFTFPARNRIISGLSCGVLVVEADEKSGALITAQHALEQNRDVFAVPGSIFSPRSDGTNTLLQKGAKPVRSAQDIIDEYAHLPIGKTSPQASVSTSNPAEEKILAILKNGGPYFIDAIIRESGMETSSIIAALSLLELHGIVKSSSDGQYRLVNSTR